MFRVGVRVRINVSVRVRLRFRSRVRDRFRSRVRGAPPLPDVGPLIPPCDVCVAP